MADRALDALGFVEQTARACRKEAEERVCATLSDGSGSGDPTPLVEGARLHGRLTLNFHPDRIARDGRSVAAGFLETGRYRPQSETGISNGSRSAIPGGDRTGWERTLFGGVYNDESLTKPIYGALDLKRDPHGGSPAFGSCFVVLAERCLHRATFCVGDSHTGPSDIGTIGQLTSVIAGLLGQGAARDGLGRGLSVANLCGALRHDAQAEHPARCLDAYIEAQVHGGVDLQQDVDSIVLDPSFRGTDVEATLLAASNEFGFGLGWHKGSELEATQVPSDFRGPTMPDLAIRTARPDGILDAAAIGAAIAQVPLSAPFAAGDPPEHMLQQYKYLGHCLLRFGHDAT